MNTIKTQVREHLPELLGIVTAAAVVLLLALLGV